MESGSERLASRENLMVFQLYLNNNKLKLMLEQSMTLPILSAQNTLAGMRGGEILLYPQQAL